MGMPKCLNSARVNFQTCGCAIMPPALRDSSATLLTPKKLHAGIYGLERPLTLLISARDIGCTQQRQSVDRAR